MKYLVLLTLLFFGCNDKPTDSNNEPYSVAGQVTNSNGPVADANVNIDKKTNWETATSESGEFSISDVSYGDHTLYIRKRGQEEDFIEKSYPIFVNTQIVLDNLILPIPVRLYPPTNITQTEMTILWNQTDADDFREYKVYKKDSPGLDETTGELIYVSTFRDDTLFVDENLIPYETYYYRVYLMNEIGRLGGSNIESASALGGNLIPDGGFDDPASFDENWFIEGGGGTLSYNDSVKIAGNYSLYGLLPYYVKIVSKKRIQLAAGKTYELSGWGKANGFYRPTYEWVGIGIAGDNFGQSLQFCVGPIGPIDSVDIDWTFKSKYFTPTENVSAEITLWGGFDRVWFDELKLEVVE